jgi:hypothetical protein
MIVHTLIMPRTQYPPSVTDGKFIEYLYQGSDLLYTSLPKSAKDLILDTQKKQNRITGLDRERFKNEKNNEHVQNKKAPLKEIPPQMKPNNQESHDFFNKKSSKIKIISDTHRENNHRAEVTSENEQEQGEKQEWKQEATKKNKIENIASFFHRSNKGDKIIESLMTLKPCKEKENEITYSKKQKQSLDRLMQLYSDKLDSIEILDEEK